MWIEDIDIVSDGKWNTHKDPYVHFPGKQLDQKHLLNCQYLLGKNQILSYIPEYKDIFNGSLEEQIYTSRILKENHTNLKAQQRTMWTGASLMFYCDMSLVTVVDLQ